MRKLLVTVTMAATAYAALPALAATDADCQALWAKADVNKDGVLSDAEAMRYSAAMRVHETKMPPTASLPRRPSWRRARQTSIDASGGSGCAAQGRQSFTQGQAKDRAIAHGATDIGPIAKDGDGVWRGPAKMDGKPTQVAVDYKGNVVFQPTP